MNVTQISEDFLHYVWNLQCFDKTDLTTEDGNTLEVLQKGIHNHDAGPDFFSGKIKLEDTVWAGNIEIHLSSSDWLKHNHQDDPKYDNVILHVVYNHDKEVLKNLGKNIPTLVLKDRIPKHIFDNYLVLKSSALEIPCQGKIADVPDIIINGMIEKTAVERIEQKTLDLNRIFKSTEENWEESFYILLARYFGARVNSDAFERLARSVSSITLLKHSNDLSQIEAMLMGQSGLLPSGHENKIVKEWIREYSLLSAKYNLKPLSLDIWKFARMRPVSFPTIRISQFAHLIFKKDKLFSLLLESSSNEDLKKILEVKASPFWDDHYHFNKESNHQPKKLGTDARNTIIINAVVSMLYFYGEKMNNPESKARAISLLESLKSEDNKIIRQWKSNNVISKDALQSQGLIQLKKTYCDSNRCLQCSIGNHIIKSL